MEPAVSVAPARPPVASAVASAAVAAQRAAAGKPRCFASALIRRSPPVRDVRPLPRSRAPAARIKEITREGDEIGARFARGSISSALAANPTQGIQRPRPPGDALQDGIEGRPLSVVVRSPNMT